MPVPRKKRPPAKQLPAIDTPLAAIVHDPKLSKALDTFGVLTVRDLLTRKPEALPTYYGVNAPLMNKLITALRDLDVELPPAWANYARTV